MADIKRIDERYSEFRKEVQTLKDTFKNRNQMDPTHIWLTADHQLLLEECTINEIGNELLSKIIIDGAEKSVKRIFGLDVVWSEQIGVFCVTKNGDVIK